MEEDKKIKKLKGYAVRYRPDGEVQVKVMDDDSIEEIAWEPVEAVTPVKFRDRHAAAMLVLAGLIEEIKARKRDVPALREELEQLQMEKSIWKDLEKMNMVAMRAIRLVNTKTKKQVGDRSVVVPTALGRAWIELKRKEHEQSAAISGRDAYNQGTEGPVVSDKNMEAESATK